MNQRPSYEELEKRIAELEQQVDQFQTENPPYPPDILSILMEAFRYIPRCKKFEDAAKHIFDHCKRLTGACSGYVALLSENGDENEVLYLDAGGLPCDVDPNLPMPIRGLRETAYKTKQVACDNAFTESPWLEYMPEGHVKLENVLFTPLNIQDKTVGVIGIANKPKGFNQRDIQTAKIFGDLAAVALTYARTHDSLKESETKYRHLVSNLPGTAYQLVLHPKGDLSFEYMGENCTELFDVGAAEIMANANLVFDLIPQPDADFVKTAIKKSAETLTPYDIKHRVVKQNGKTIWVHALSIPRKHSNGNIVWDGIGIDITEQKKNEILIQKKNTDLRLAQRIASLGTWTLDPEIGVPEWSEEIYRIHERDPKLGPYPLAEYKTIFREEWWERFSSATKSAISKGIPYDIELKLEFPSGKEKWIHAICDPDPKLGPKGHRLRGTIQDITEKRQASIALEETKNRYESIYQNAQAGLSRTRISDGKILECNQKMADIFGYDNTDEFVAKGILSDHYVDKEMREKVLSELHQTGFIHNKEARFYRKDGQIIWARFDSRIFPEYGFMDDVVIDITEQKKAEERLLQQQKAISLNNRIANVFLTSSGNDIFSNTLDVVLETLESPFGYFGYIDEEGNLNCPSMTRNIWDKCDIPDKSILFLKDIWGGLWGESLKKAKTILSNSGLKLPEGHIQITCAMAVPIIHHEKLIGQFVVANKKEGYYQYEKYLLENAASQTAPILNSLLEKKAHEKEHKRMQARIEQAQKMEAVGNLAGGIAHDFNNILFPIVGLSEMMLDDFLPGSIEQQNLNEIFQAGKRGRKLVQQILSFSRQSEHQPIPVHIQKILKEVLKLCRATIPADIPIIQDIKPDCGPVMADPTQIHQIAMNLITNAFHAVEPTGGTIKVALKEIDFCHEDDPNVQLASGRYAVLSIIDTGIGIDPAVMNRIFDPYFTTKEKGRGTGLGLATVYGIVTAHGGDIRVHSEIGKGASFGVHLPLMEKAPYSEPEKEMAPLPTGTGHIMLVDDEKSIIHLETQMLERLGYQTSGFTGSRDALAAFKIEPSRFDLVITDMNMPNMNGMQLAAELIAIRSDIPIILCTGFSERINDKKAEALGIGGLLMKPVGMKDLALKVREVLDITKKEI